MSCRKCRYLDEGKWDGAAGISHSPGCQRNLEVGPGETCSQCPHPFDDHLVIATTDDPLAGGVIICPVRDCDCHGTWDIKHPDTVSGGGTGDTDDTAD